MNSPFSRFIANLLESIGKLKSYRGVPFLRLPPILDQDRECERKRWQGLVGKHSGPCAQRSFAGQIKANQRQRMKYILDAEDREEIQLRAFVGACKWSHLPANDEEMEVSNYQQIESDNTFQ